MQRVQQKCQDRLREIFTENQSLLKKLLDFAAITGNFLDNGTNVGRSARCETVQAVLAVAKRYTQMQTKPDIVAVKVLLQYVYQEVLKQYICCIFKEVVYYANSEKVSYQIKNVTEKKLQNQCPMLETLQPGVENFIGQTIFFLHVPEKQFPVHAENKMVQTGNFSNPSCRVSSIGH